MSFVQYVDTPPDKIGQVTITLAIGEQKDPITGVVSEVKTGTYHFHLIDSSTGTVVDTRTGSLDSSPAAINGTSITLSMLSTWLDELKLLAEGTLPS